MSTKNSISLESCRLCQQETGVASLQNERLQRRIFIITQVEIKSELDKLMPQKICESCCKVLDDVDLYRKKVQEVDKNLKLLAEKQRISSIPTVDISNNLADKLSNKSKYRKVPSSFDKGPGIHKHSESSPVNGFCCPICQKRYRKEKNYEQHKQSHTELFCKKCHNTFSCESQTQKHICVNQEIVPDDNYKSKSGCGKQTAKNSGSDYNCAVCNVEFENKKSFATHLKEHKEKREFVCCKDGCSKVLPSSYLLKIHKLMHEGKKPFLCVTCGKGCLTKNALNCHEKIHLDTKSYHCEWCNLGFSVRSNLRAHIRVYHEGMRYYCSQCAKAFVSKWSLDRHEKTHSGIKEFKCQECSFEFYTNKELRKHQRYHQGLRPFQCDQCLKTFFESHHLTMHLMIHSGERPHVCEIFQCGKSFIDKQKLKRHQITKHNIVHHSVKSDS